MVEPDALGVQLFTVGEPQEAVRNVIADIEGLVADGQLRTGQAQGLTQPLVNAIRSLDRDQLEPACGQLGGVSERSIPEAVLDPATAEDVIAQVDAIEAHLGCTRGGIAQ